MMDDSPELEALQALEARTGHLHTVDDWHYVCRKSARTPEKLTNDDIVIIGAFDSPQKAASARERRAKALVPDLPAPPALPAAAPAQTAPAPSWTAWQEDLLEMLAGEIAAVLKETAVDPIKVVLQRVAVLEAERTSLANLVLDLTARVVALEARVVELEEAATLPTAGQGS